MKVRKTCLKCGHAASVVLYDLATCPRCGALYAKTDEAQAAAQAAASRTRRRKLALQGIAELRGATGAEKRAANCPAVDLAEAEVALHRIGTFDSSGVDLQLRQAAEPLARAHGEAFVRAVAAIAACRNALLTALTVRREDGGEFAVFASEDGWVRLY